MRKYIILLLIAFILIPTIACGEEMFVICKPDDYVNVRMSPYSNSAVVGRFECGDSFETDGKTKTDKKGRKWLHIINASLESSEAWICNSYVQSTQVTVERAKATVVAKGRTAVRKAPNGKVRKWVKNGSILKVLAYSDEWALTTNGYISLSCIEVWYE